jgi:hypothetical protein
MVADPTADDSPSCSRALVVPFPQATRATQPRRPVQRATTFLTHLIATAHQVPQARERRRADAGEVIAAYQATVARLRALDNDQ